MKILLFLMISMILASCASVDSIKKSSDCVVWRDQKYLGPYSIEVVDNKVYWDSKCKAYKSSCKGIDLSMDESFNVMSSGTVLGKIENNELRFTENHSLSNLVNFTAVRAYPEQKIVKLSVIDDSVATEETLQYNEKCTPQQAILGGVAVGTISEAQKKKQ